MALDYASTSELMSDMALHGRVKVACLHFASYIAGEPADVPAHATRYKWAQNTFLAPDAAATQVTPTVVMDDAVQQAGAQITDAALQSAVENAVNKII